MDTRYVLPTSQDLKSYPEIPLCQSFTQFLATVTVSKYDDRSLGNQKNQLREKQVGFNICGLPEFTGKYPVADPMFDYVREMKVGDLILVRDVGSGCLHTFLYLPYREDLFTGLWNRNNVISISNPNQTRIMVFSRDQDLKTPEDAEKEENAACSIVLDYSGPSDHSITLRSKGTSIEVRSDGTVNVSAKKVNIKGDVVITGDLKVSKEVTAGTKSIKLSSHVHSVSGSNAGGAVEFIPTDSTGGPQ